MILAKPQDVQRYSPNTHPNLLKRLCIKGKRRGGCFVNTPPNSHPKTPPNTHPSGSSDSQGKKFQGWMLGGVFGGVLGGVLGGVFERQNPFVYQGFRRFWGEC